MCRENDFCEINDDNCFTLGYVGGRCMRLEQCRICRNYHIYKCQRNCRDFLYGMTNVGF